MNFRTTKKAINNGYATRIYCGYCSLQQLLRFENPIAHTTRREGWGADVYEVSPSTVIVTGYAPFGNVNADHDVCRKYEEAANEIYEEYRKNTVKWEQVKLAYEALIAKFVKEVTHTED